MLSHAAGTGDEFSQVITMRAIAARRLGSNSGLMPQSVTESIGILIIVPRRPAHMVVPAPAAEDHRGCAYSRKGNAERPSPAPESPA